MSEQEQTEAMGPRLRCRKHTDCRGNGGALKGEWCSFFEFICVEPCPECLAEAKKEGREEANEGA